MHIPFKYSISKMSLIMNSFKCAYIRFGLLQLKNLNAYIIHKCIISEIISRLQLTNCLKLYDI